MVLTIDYYNLCLVSFQLKIATTESLRIYVEKNKITADQYFTITGVVYVP